MTTFEGVEKGPGGDGSCADGEGADPIRRLAGFNFDLERARELVSKLQADVDSSDAEYDQGDKFIVDFDEFQGLIWIADAWVSSEHAETDDGGRS